MKEKEALEIIQDAFINWQETDYIEFEETLTGIEYLACTEVFKGNRDLIILQHLGDGKYAKTRLSEDLERQWLKHIIKYEKEIEENTKDIYDSELEMAREYHSSLRLITF